MRRLCDRWPCGPTWLWLGILLSAPLAWAQPPTHDLIKAAARCDAASIPALVAQGADPNAGYDLDKSEVGSRLTNVRLTSTLTIAVYCGDLATARALISAGAKPALIDVYYAMSLSQIAIAHLLLDATVLSPDESNAAVISALASRTSTEVATMIRRGLVQQVLTGQSQASDDLNWEQLGTIAFVNDPADPVFGLLDRLIARGFAVDVLVDGKTAFQIASINGDLLLARGLKARGAKVPLDWTDQREKEIQIVGAATKGNLVGVATLLGEGVSPNAADLEGDYALPAALANRHFDIAARLISAGSNPKLLGPTQPSVLASAAKFKIELIKTLVSKGADPNQSDGTDSFPLMSAARYGHTKAIMALLAHGANAAFVDSHKRTALHYLIEPDVKSLYWPSNRQITPAHLEAVRLLAGAGLPLNAVDEDGASVITSNLGHGASNLELMQQLLDAGVRATVADLDKAIEFGNAGVLRTMLRRGPPSPLPESTLSRAVGKIEQEPDLAVAILEYGVRVPSNPTIQRNYLEAAAGAASESVLGLLLASGIPIAIDPEGRGVQAALYYGRPKSIALLAARGADLQGKDKNGKTALHRFIANDTSGAWPTRIEQPQRNAVTALIDAGFQLTSADNNGKTVVALAQSKPSTLAALSQAVAAAGANSTGIHAAIRSGSVNEIRRLASDPLHREALDTLGRTPLSFALQAKNWTAARVLLRAGALISLSSHDSWQPADTSFASERDIAGAFAVRLLSPTLVAIPDDITTAGLVVARQAYQTSRTLPFNDFSWRINCEARATTCGDGIGVMGNTSIFFDFLESVRFDRGAKSSFGLVQRNLRSIHLSTGIDLASLGGPRHFDFGEITFVLTGSLSIPPCDFTFERPSCSPGIRIYNPNTASGFSIQTDTGYEKLPSATLRYTQLHGANGTVAPDESVILDRSAGAITLEMDQVRARVFALYVEVERLEGEVVETLPADPSVANRMKFYARLAQLRARRSAVPTTVAERAADKTLASTVAALSVEAYIANYPTVVLALLRQQADVVANLDLQVRSIQNAVLAQATYTPGQIDALVAQIDVALAVPTTSNVDVLRNIRTELVRLRASVDASGIAVNELRTTLFTDADLFIELYQALVLEYRQFVPSTALDTAIGPTVRQAIAARISPRDVIIGDAAAGGMGKALRVHFGLPDPTP